MQKRAKQIIHWNTTLHPIDFPKDIKNFFFELSLGNRSKFVNWMGKISKNNFDNLDWWIKLPASRDPYKSNLYKNIIILMVLKSKKFNKNIFSLVVDSEALVKTIQNQKSINTDICKIKIKKSNYSLILFLKSIVFQIVIFLLVKILSQEKFLKKINKITLIDTFVSCNEKLKDFVYPGLDKIIKKNKIKNIFFVPNIVFSRNIFNLIKNIVIMTRKNYIFKEHYINLKEFFLCFYQTLYSFPKNIGKFKKYYGIDCTLIIRDELHSKKDFYTEFQSRLKLSFIKDLKLKKLAIKKAIGRFENHSIDKAWNYGFRKYFPKIELLGYQGFLWLPHLANESPTSYEDKAKIIPKKIILTGKILRKPRLEFYKKLKVIIGPSLGKQEIFNSFKKTYKYKFVVALCGIKSLDEKMILWSKDVIKNSKKLRIIIKPHPILPLNKIINLKELNIYNNRITIFNEDIKSLLQKTDVLISSGPTSVVFESIAYGCKLFYLFLDPSDPLIFKNIPVSKTYFTFINNKEDLLKNMNSHYRKKDRKFNKKFKSSFYTKINKSNIKIFL